MKKITKKVPWKDFCCEACWFAKEKKCRCRCGGAGHGKGVVKKGEGPLDKFPLEEERKNEMSNL